MKNTGFSPRSTIFTLMPDAKIAAATNASTSAKPAKPCDTNTITISANVRMQLHPRVELMQKQIAREKLTQRNILEHFSLPPAQFSENRALDVLHRVNILRNIHSLFAQRAHELCTSRNVQTDRTKLIAVSEYLGGRAGECDLSMIEYVKPIAKAGRTSSIECETMMTVTPRV